MDISFTCWLRVIRVLFCVFGYLHCWRSWQSRIQGVRRYRHPCRPNWSSLRSACLSNELLLTHKTSGLVKTQVPDYQDFQITRHRFKEFCYTGCPRRNGQNFGRVYLMLKYTDITQNTYIQSWTVMEIMAREVWKYDSCYTLTDYQIHIKTGRNMWFL